MTRALKDVPLGAMRSAVQELMTELGFPTARIERHQDALGYVLTFGTETPVTDEAKLRVWVYKAGDRMAPRFVFGLEDYDGIRTPLEEIAPDPTNKNVSALIEAAVGQFNDWKTTAKGFITSLKRRAIDADGVAAFLNRCARETATTAVKIPWANVAKTDVMFNGCEGENLWHLLNCFSLVTRNDPETKQVPRVLLFVKRLKALL